MSRPVPTPAPASEAAALVRAAGVVLIDLDGCLAFGNRPHPAAPALIDAVDGRYVILSNNSTETPDSLARTLSENGLVVDPARIVLAGALMVDLLAAEGHDAPLTLLASPRIRAYARSRRLDVAAEAADGAPGTVALARDTTLTFAGLDRALGRLARGAALVVSNPDLTHPGADGRPVLETGGLLAALTACVPAVRPRIVGKPARQMFETALRLAGVGPERAVMVGDNPRTDGAGAEGCGIRPLLVGPGNPLRSIAELL